MGIQDDNESPEEDPDDPTYEEYGRKSYWKDDIEDDDMLFKAINRPDLSKVSDKEYKDHLTVDRSRESLGLQNDKKKMRPFDDAIDRHRLLEPPKESDIRKCKHCDAEFATLKGLENHSLNHFEDKIWPLMPTRRPFQCPSAPECNEAFKEKITLMRHYAFAHYTDDKDMSFETLSKKSRYTVVGSKKINNDVRNDHYNDNTITKDLNSNSIESAEPNDIVKQTMELFSKDVEEDSPFSLSLKVMSVDKINSLESIDDLKSYKNRRLEDNIMNSNYSNIKESHEVVDVLDCSLDTDDRQETMLEKQEVEILSDWKNVPLF